MSPDFDVAVVGAGLAGAASAVALAGWGYTVALLSDGATGASTIPAAVMAPYPTAPTDRLTRLRARGARYTTALLDRLERQGLDSGRRARGVFLLPASLRERRRHERARAHPHGRVEALTPTEAEQRIGLRPPQAGLLHKQGSCVVPDRLARALVHGGGPRVTVHRVCVGYIEQRAGDVALREADGGLWGRASLVVLAAGMASPDLWPSLGARLRPVRGQATAWSPSQGTASLRMPVSSGGYITPVVDGYQWTGGTAQPGETDLSARAEDDRANLARLRVIDPDYPETTPSSRFVGVRAVTSDRMPLVERVAERVWVNTGHGAHGLMSAPWSGLRLARALSRLA